MIKILAQTKICNHSSLQFYIKIKTMRTYNSEQLITALQKQTEGFLDKAVAEWQMLSSVKLLYQSSPEKWSAAQCLEHLNSYGDYYLPAIENAILKAKQKNSTASNEFVPGWFGNYFTELMLPKEDGKKIKKMKAMKAYSPINDLDASAVISKFIDQQEKMLLLLEEARKVDLGKIHVPVSIAKWLKLKLGDTFLFVIAHNYRHVLQAQKALECSGIKTVFVPSYSTINMKQAIG